MKDKVIVKNEITAEKFNLDNKIEKLSSFVLGTVFLELSTEQRHALWAHLKAMYDYSKALRVRIMDITRQEVE